MDLILGPHLILGPYLFPGPNTFLFIATFKLCIMCCGLVQYALLLLLFSLLGFRLVFLGVPTQSISPPPLLHGPQYGSGGGGPHVRAPTPPGAADNPIPTG